MTLTGIFDSHAHYDDEKFDPDRQTVLEGLEEKGVLRVVNVGADLASSRAAVALAEKYPFVYAAVGVHPYEAGKLPEKYLEELAALAVHPKVVAIGEIGLDCHYKGEWIPYQEEVFAAQMEMAASLGLPVVIHDRDAHGDTLRLLRQYRPAGVVHCFSGSAEMAKEVAALGLYLGFTGVVTFQNARRALEAAAAAPLDRILVETDCPYLAPEPFRSRRCDSSMLPYTVAALAKSKKIPPQEMADHTRENAGRLFKVPLKGNGQLTNNNE